MHVSIIINKPYGTKNGIRMRCIVIDPYSQTIMEQTINVKKSTLYAMYDKLGVDLVECLSFDGYDLWFNEEGRFTEERYFTLFDKSNGNVWQIFGPALVLSCDHEEGETIALNSDITVDTFTDIVSFEK
jgi:hypothetical protein